MKERNRELARMLANDDEVMSDAWNRYLQADEDNFDVRADCIEEIGHRFLDLLGVPRK